MALLVSCVSIAIIIITAVSNRSEAVDERLLEGN